MFTDIKSSEESKQELMLVNYCHPDCVPMMNIMRLPEEEAYAKAYEMAAQHPETTAFYRFADFETFLKATGRGYVEVQLWSDKYVK